MNVEKRRAERERWHAGLPTEHVRFSDTAKAGRIVDKAIRDGVLRPWPVCAVPTCNQRRVQAHHVCYEPFWWLDVIWLCRRCHAQLHAEHAKYRAQ